MDRMSIRAGSGAAVACLALFALSCATSGSSEGEASAGADRGGESTESSAGAERIFTDSDVIAVGDSPVRGPVDAPVTVVEFADFQCPYCKKGWRIMKRLREDYPDRVRVVLKHFPLASHANARPAARVAMAAGKQGEEYLWTMQDRLYEHQSEWAEGDVREMAVDWAEEVGLDVEKFERDLEQKRDAFNRRIQKDSKLGGELGVEGVPHFFVNGTRVAGVYDYSKFEQVVEDRLAEIEKLREKGTPTDQLYRRAVRNNYEPKSSPSSDSADGDAPDEGGGEKGDYL